MRSNVCRLGLYLLIVIACCIWQDAFAQPPEGPVTVLVQPDRPDWNYNLKDKVTFTITVLKDGRPIKDVMVRYQYGPEKFPVKEDSSMLSAGSLTINAGTLKVPGFLRCMASAKVDGKEYRGLATAGFQPLRIKPTIEDASDFIVFWDQVKSALAKVPMDAEMTLLPDRCTENVNVYHVSIQNLMRSSMADLTFDPYQARFSSRIYGILSVPKAEGKYPAVLYVPGAGVRPYTGQVAMAENGLITFEIGIHGIPVTMDPAVYTDLYNGILNGYMNYNMDSRDRYYYKRVYAGCIRANDFLTSLPQYDGKNLAVTGGSQGGALAIVTAALDPRVKVLTATYPALSDVTGYLHNRAGGWPHMFDKKNLPYNDSKDKKETMKYYDVVNFARRLKVPGYYTWGFNDETCPPTSMYAAYNVIAAPKELYLVQETGHWTYPEQRDKVNNWLITQLISGKD